MFDDANPDVVPALMCLDGDGTPLFTTERARVLCDRWNRNLDESGGCGPIQSLRLPATIDALMGFAGQGNDSPERSRDDATMPARWSMVHPLVDALTVTVHAGVQSPAERAGRYLLCFEERASSSDRLKCLSPRERRVALLAAEGLRNEQIAERLCRSRRTVEFQLNSVYRKLDVSSRTQLLRVLL